MQDRIDKHRIGATNLLPTHCLKVLAQLVNGVSDVSHKDLDQIGGLNYFVRPGAVPSAISTHELF
jgi:hypothetical protein